MVGDSLISHAEIVMGQSPPGDTCNTEGLGLPLLNGPTEYGEHYPIPVQFTTDARKRAEPGDILFCVRGSTTGRMNWADQEYAIGRGVAAIRHKATPALQPYVRAVIEHNLPSLLVQATGSTFPNVSAAQLASLRWPPLEESEQSAIAFILGTLDDKIELNRRMNQTLESIARAVFKSWFVDFDPVRAKADGRQPADMDAETAALFPDSFEDSELGKIPSGWAVSSIGDVSEVVDCLHSKKPQRRDSGKPLLQLCNIRDDGLIDMSDTYLIEQDDYDKWISRIEASPGDCVVTNVGRVGAVSQIPDGMKAALGRNMTAVRPKPSFPYRTFLIKCLLSQAMRDEIQLKTDTGTILDALNVKDIPRLRFVNPGESLTALFEDKCRSIWAKMEQGLRESQNLAQVRDTLLPKLISGQIRVKDAEKFVEEHAG